MTISEPTEPARKVITVVDLSTGVAGPYCAKVIGGFGAEVTKVEDPRGGDPTRRLGPFPGDIPHPEKSGLFLNLNLNKRGITLNLDCATGRKLFLELLRGADILVESHGTKALEEMGLGPATLEAANPRLVHTCVTPFGGDGPYQDYRANDIQVYAMGGQMLSQGLPDREPLNLAPNVVLYQTGLLAALGALGAYYAVEREGRGQMVDASQVEMLTSSADGRTNALVSYQFAGGDTRRDGYSARGYPNGFYPCADGYIHFHSPGRFAQAVRMIGRPDLLQDPRFATPEAQGQPGRREEFMEIFRPWLMAHTKREIWKLGLEYGFYSAPVSTTQDIIDDPHFRERGAWAEVDHPVLGKTTVPGPPVQMASGSCQVRRPAPLLGEHNAEVYGSLGYSRQELVILRAAGVI